MSAPRMRSIGTSPRMRARRTRWTRARSVLAIALVARVAIARAVDPCDASRESGVRRGGALAVGLAFWPGASARAWDGFHPCANRTALGALGVGTMTFEANAAELTALRGTRADEDGLYGTNGSATAMTAVAYTATKRSAARVVRLEVSDASSGGRSGVVSQLTLLVTLEGGGVTYLRWHDVGCGNCGGTGNERCLPVGDGDHACSASKAGCDGTCVGAACDVALNTTDALRCQLTVALATSGTDANNEAFVLGTQLERLSKYASSGAYTSAAASASAAATGVTGFIAG